MADDNRNEEKYPCFSYEAIKREIKEDSRTDSIKDSGYMAAGGWGDKVNVAKSFILFTPDGSAPTSVLAARAAFRSKSMTKGQTKQLSAQSGQQAPSSSGGEEAKVINPCCRFLLKIHVSLNENDDAQYAKGWGIIKDILIDAKVKRFKIVRPGSIMSKTAGQEGKDITIYCSANVDFDAARWLKIMEDITVRLHEAGVDPGYRPPGTAKKFERYVQGSNYLSYRLENDLVRSHEGTSDTVNSEYLACEELIKQLSKLSIDIPNQKPIQKKGVDANAAYRLK